MSVRIHSYVSLAAVALVTGCYSQVSIGVAVPAPGTQVVAQLTDIGTIAMANQIGPGATEVQGEVRAASDTSWSLALLRVDQRGGISSPWNREVVLFPRSALTQVRERRLDKKRSWLAAGVIAVGAFLGARAFGAFTTEESGGIVVHPPA